jgi:hypothetical protein
MYHCVREGKIVEARVIKVDHPAALDTNQMVMSVRFNLKPCRCARVAHLTSQVDPDQGLQDPVYSGSRYPRKENGDIFSDLIRSRVIMAMQKSFQNDPALHGQRDTVLTAQRFEFSHFRG